MSEPKPVTCRGCKHLDVPPRSDGKRIANRRTTYRCTVKAQIPACMERLLPPFRHSMFPDQEHSCRFFETREKPHA